MESVAMRLMPATSAVAKKPSPALVQLRRILRRPDSNFADLPELVNAMKKLGMRKIEFQQNFVQGVCSVLPSSAKAVGWLLLWLAGVILFMIAISIFLLLPIDLVSGKPVRDWATYFMTWGILIATCLAPLPGVVQFYMRLRMGDPTRWKAHAAFWAILAGCMGIAVLIDVWLAHRFGYRVAWEDAMPIAAIGLFSVNFVSQVVSRYYALCPAAAGCQCRALTYCGGLCRRATGTIQRFTDQIRANANGTICCQCLLRISLWHDDAVNLAYYTCRGCGTVFDDGGFLDRNHVLVAVLDRRATVPQQVTDRHILVHVIQNHKLIDLDRVLVHDAGEEDVERYVMLLQNDSDEERRGRYARATCVVNAAHPLSGHAMSVLRSTFAGVQVCGT